MLTAFIGYRGSENLGDAVQTYALSELLGLSPDFLVDRDDLRNTEVSQPVNLIANGWFAQRPEAFGFDWAKAASFVSIHLSPFAGRYSRLSMVEVLARSPELQESLRCSGPVGARDLATLAVLEDCQIPAYFSACTTLHLRPRNVVRGDEILAVDVDPKTLAVLRERTNREIRAITNKVERSWLDFESICEDVGPYLDRLAASALVITSRIHAALPSIALGTPVIFAPQDVNDPRFGGLLDFIPTVVQSEHLSQIPLDLLDEPFRGSVRRPEDQLGPIQQALEFSPKPISRQGDESELSNLRRTLHAVTVDGAAAESENARLRAQLIEISARAAAAEEQLMRLRGRRIVRLGLNVAKAFASLRSFVRYPK